MIQKNYANYLKLLPVAFSSSPRTLFFIIGVIFFSMGFILIIFNKNELFSSQAQKMNVSVELTEAEEYLKQNSKESAKESLRIFNRILANSPTLDIKQRAKYGVAVALERLEENAAALEYYRELKSQNIKNIRLKDKVDYAIGRFYLYLNYEKEGSSILHDLLTRTHDAKLKSKIYTAFGMYYLRRSEYKRAEENFRVAINYNQENLQAEEGRAKALKRQGKDWVAYRYYDNYLVGISNLNPSKREKVVNQVEQEIFDSGIKAFRRGRYQNAISFFKKLCRASQDPYIEENSRFWIGESYAALGLHKKAMKLYSSVLDNTIDAKDAISLFRKGEILFQKNKHKEAAKIFEQIYHHYPQSEYSLKAKRHLDDIHEEVKEQTAIEQNLNTKREIIEEQATINIDKEKDLNTKKERISKETPTKAK